MFQLKLKYPSGLIKQVYSMRNDTIPCCAADALRRIRQIPINGIMTGITMLDESIADVKARNLAS